MHNLWLTWCKTMLFLNWDVETLWREDCIQGIVHRSLKKYSGMWVVFEDQSCGVIAEGRSGRGWHCRRWCYRSDRLDGFILSPVTVSLSRRLLPASAIGCLKLTFLPFHFLSIHLFSWWAIYHPAPFNVNTGHFRWVFGQPSIYQLHVDSPQVNFRQRIFPHVLTHVKPHWYISVCSVGCYCSKSKS